MNLNERDMDRTANDIVGIDVCEHLLRAGVTGHLPPLEEMRACPICVRRMWIAAARAHRWVPLAPTDALALFGEMAARLAAGQDDLRDARQQGFFASLSLDPAREHAFARVMAEYVGYSGRASSIADRAWNDTFAEFFPVQGGLVARDAQAAPFADEAEREAALAFYGQVTAIYPPDSPVAASAHLSWGDALQDRFFADANPADLDAAIAHYEHALAIFDPLSADGALCRMRTGDALLARFEIRADAADLAEAIALYAAAAAMLPAASEEWAACTMNQGVALEMRYAAHGAPADLDAALAQYVAVRRVVERGTEEWARCRMNEALALQQRYESRTALDDLTLAQHAYRDALRVFPPDSPEGRSCTTNERAVRRRIFALPPGRGVPTVVALYGTETTLVRLFRDYRKGIVEFPDWRTTESRDAREAMSDERGLVLSPPPDDSITLNLENTDPPVTITFEDDDPTEGVSTLTLALAPTANGPAIVRLYGTEQDTEAADIVLLTRAAPEATLTVARDAYRRGRIEIDDLEGGDDA